jgi:hypothetical protein
MGDKMADRRKRGLFEVHTFYSRQHIPIKRNFEELEDIISRVSLSEFMKFCTDFGIGSAFDLSNKDIVEVFKKSSFAHTPLTFENMQSALERFSIMVNDKRIKENEAKLESMTKEHEKILSAL